MAFCVAFEHIFYFQSGYPDSPFELGHTSLGYFAVNGFFIISGYLITGSAVRSGTLANFMRSRLLRIMPALIVISFILGLILVPLLGELDLKTYFSTGAVWLSMLGLITFIESAPEWPGLIMAGNPFAGDLTGPIWTLRYEALAYVGTGLLLLLGLHKKKLITILAALAATIAFIIDLQTGLLTEFSPAIASLVRFGSCYLYGVWAYQSASYLNLGWIAGLIGIAIGGLIIVTGLPAGEVIFNIGLAPLIFAIAFAKVSAPDWLTPKTDFSYGLYIFHWPIYQLLYESFGGANIFPLLLLAGLPLAFLAAGFSWYIIEKPALKLKAATAIKPA